MNDRLVLCLGNEILSDDGLGFVVAQQLQLDPARLNAEVESASLAGFSLLDLLRGRREVLVVDAIQTGSACPGTIHEFPSDCLAPTLNLVGSHQINLPTAIELGRMCGMAMPDRIDVIAVEASDVQTLHEGLTPAVTKAVPEVVALIRQWAARPPSPNPAASKSSVATHP